MPEYVIDLNNFSGSKFAARYGLNSFAGDFFIRGNTLVVNTVLPEPLIFDPPDTELQANRTEAKVQIDSEVVLRALALTILDEFNLHAAKLNAILDAVDAATSLADLKTRVGAIADYPVRTAQQLITSIKAKIDEGIE